MVVMGHSRGGDVAQALGPKRLTPLFGSYCFIVSNHL